MKTAFADSNIFLRYLLDDVPEQTKVVEKYFSQAQNGELSIRVCQIVIFEIDYILEKYLGIDKPRTVEMLKSIVNLPIIELEDLQAFIEALGLYSKKNVDLVDCFIYSKDKNEGGELLSFDKDFKKLDNL